MTFSAAALRLALPDDPEIKRVWVALSGGLDSVVLLHALSRLKLPVPVAALHINHQISPNAYAWQAHCQAVCEALAIPLCCETVTVERRGRGLEDAAREARYAVFQNYMAEGDVLLTAHHADDQAETLLLRLMRGSGPRGLAAMAATRPLGRGLLVRPLLRFSRAELQGYAEIEQLSWINDESNEDTHYDRNYLRQQVMPLLRERWPAFTHQWQQTAEHCASQQRLLDALAAQWLVAAGPRPERIGASLSLSYLAGLSVEQRALLWRYWLRLQHYTTPEQTHLQQLDQQLFGAAADAEVDVCWGDICVRRYRDRVYCLPISPSNSTARLADTMNVILSPEQNLTKALPRGGLLRFDYIAAAQGGELKAGLEDLSIRWREGGERCQPESRAHSQVLKKLLQEYALEPWWRAEVPLIYSADQLVAVGDLWVCRGFAAQAGQAGYKLRWQLA